MAPFPMPPAWAVPPQRREHRPPDLAVKFNSDPKQLAFFLTQVWTYMQEYGTDLLNNPAKVRIVTMALEGKAAELIVVLHDDNAAVA